MKKLSDYKDEKAIELWADLLAPLSKILSDKKVAKVVQSGKPKLDIAQTILGTHPKEAKEILLRIDDTPLDGLNIVLRLMTLLSDIGQNEELKGFFGFAEQVQMESESFISVTENTEAEEK